MSTTADRKFVELLTAVDPFLNKETRESCHAIKGMVELFPGLSLKDVAKKMAAYAAKANNSAGALAERARAIIDGSSEESVPTWLADVAKLSPPDLKKLGKELALDLSSDKDEVVGDLQRWLESRGTIKLPDAKERAERFARQLAGELPARMRAVDADVASEVIRKAEEVFKDKKIGKDVFEAFGKALGISVFGTKANMLKQIKEFVTSLARSHVQTQF